MSFNPKEHMMPLKGKEYLQVMWRLVWFREEHPLWQIDTQLVEHDTVNNKAVFRCVICDEAGMPKSSGHGSESARNFGDYLEKAETKAVGRALAMLGYGTQFAPELDEGERIVDSPVALKPRDQLIAKLKEKGMNINYFAELHHLTKDTPDDVYLALLKDLG